MNFRALFYWAACSALFVLNFGMKLVALTCNVNHVQVSSIVRLLRLCFFFYNYFVFSILMLEMSDRYLNH